MIAGYTSSGRSFDALLAGYYDSNQLIYVARVRNGFVPASCQALFSLFADLQTNLCPRSSIRPRRARDAGLTAADMRWLRPALVARIEFVEWTVANHLRHARFVGLRPDQQPWDVTREAPDANTASRARAQGQTLESPTANPPEANAAEHHP